MPDSNTIRVAVAQCSIGADLEQNLQTCLRMLDKAAECQPDLVVLPEFCNHLSWYDDRSHCHRVSLQPGDGFLKTIAAKARQLGFHVVINATLREGEEGATGTSLLFSPNGELLGSSDKQVLMGHENDFLTKATGPSPIVETPLGRLAMYACMDGVINETPRCLSLRGAQVLCNSLNSFASDEGSLHIPVRAAENRVFVAAANKVGPLIPVELLGPVSAATGIPEHFLYGAGESQIVAPDGTVLAIASVNQEEVVWADIDPSQADNKSMADGTDIYAARRPELYAAIGENPESQAQASPVGEQPVSVAVLEPGSCGPSALDAACQALGDRSIRWLALPELFYLESTEIGDIPAAITAGKAAVKQLAAACAPDQYVSTSVVSEVKEGATLSAVLIGSEGIVLRQDLVHASAQYPWAMLCDEVEHADLEIGRVAVVPGPDSRYPEYFRLLALAGVEIAAVGISPCEAWELRTGLVERAAENRINLLVAARPGSLGQEPGARGFIASLQGDFTLLTPWAERAFDGLLSQPELTACGPTGDITTAKVYPAHAANKIVSRGTDLLRGRPWYLASPMTNNHRQ